MNSIQDFITEDPDTIAAAEVDQKLNQDLGLQIPSGTLTEDLVYWQTFFRTLRNMYRSGMIDKEDVQREFIPAFIRIESKDKQAFLNELNFEVIKKEQEIAELSLVIAIEEIEQKVQKIMKLLTVEQQVEFMKQLNNGQVPEEVQSKLALMNEPIIFPEEAEQYAQYRLSQALDKRRVLDTRTFNSPLTPEAIQKVVDDHEQIELETTPELPKISTTSTPKPKIHNLFRTSKSTTLNELLNEGKETGE